MSRVKFVLPHETLGTFRIGTQSPVYFLDGCDIIPSDPLVKFLWGGQDGTCFRSVKDSSEQQRIGINPRERGNPQVQDEIGSRPVFAMWNCWDDRMDRSGNFVPAPCMPSPEELNHHVNRYDAIQLLLQDEIVHGRELTVEQLLTAYRNLYEQNPEWWLQVTCWIAGHALLRGKSEAANGPFRERHPRARVLADALIDIVSAAKPNSHPRGRP